MDNTEELIKKAVVKSITEKLKDLDLTIRIKNVVIHGIDIDRVINKEKENRNV